MVKNHSDSKRENHLPPLHRLAARDPLYMHYDTYKIVRTATFVIAVVDTGCNEKCLNTSTNRKEGNILFNDALNTFYLRLYGIRHMVNNHSYREWKPAAATWDTLSD